MELADIAKEINPVVQGWINCYGQHNHGVLKPVLQPVNQELSRWVRKKFKGLRRRKTEAVYRLGDIALQKHDLFAHWAWGGANLLQVKEIGSESNTLSSLTE
jgi:RNA-directed DNA polymerase